VASLRDPRGENGVLSEVTSAAFGHGLGTSRYSGGNPTGHAQGRRPRPSLHDRAVGARGAARVSPERPNGQKSADLPGVSFE
jgi:hypothetical protein